MKISSNLMNDNFLEKSLKILKKCESLTFPGKFGSFPQLRVLIFNNYSCYFRRNDKPQLAYNYLFKGLNILNTMKEKKYLGITHLNLCAIMSQNGLRKKALFHAKEAINYFNGFLFYFLMFIFICLEF